MDGAGLAGGCCAPVLGEVPQTPGSWKWLVRQTCVAPSLWQTRCGAATARAFKSLPCSFLAYWRLLRERAAAKDITTRAAQWFAHMARAPKRRV